MATEFNVRWKGRVYLPGGGERTRLFKTRAEAQRWEKAQSSWMGVEPTADEDA